MDVDRLAVVVVDAVELRSLVRVGTPFSSEYLTLALLPTTRLGGTP
jgi:hypothetical protein